MLNYSMRLSTRFTIAIVALVAVTAGAVGLLTYRNIAAVSVPRSLARLDAHARNLAGNLANIATNARADVKGFRNFIGLDEIIGLSRNASLESANGRTLAQWRARVGLRLVDELEAKPSYARFRIIGVADAGRELVRVERSSDLGKVRAVPDSELQRRADQVYFRQTIAANDGVIVVSPVELSQEDGATQSLNVPVLRISTPIFASDGTVFGALVIDVDLRSGFKRIDEAVDPDTAICGR